MRPDTRRLAIRVSLIAFACWAFTVTLLFGVYFGLRAAFGLGHQAITGFHWHS